MPEGDTIFRTARTLGRGPAGLTVDAALPPGVAAEEHDIAGGA